MGKIVFITGGARSGKSSFALKECSKLPGRKAFIATMEPLDGELIKRVNEHKAQRGPGWTTFEEPVEIAGLLEKLDGHGAILIDCLTLWLSNLMMRGRDVEAESEKLVTAIKKTSGTKSIFIVSNEVGMGIVPENKSGREFRDMAGTLNKRMAEAADEVYLIVSGISVKIK